MHAKSLQQAILAGVAGTAVMTVFSYVSKYLNFAHFDAHGFLTGLIGIGSLLGWVATFAVGVVLAYLYGGFFKARLPLASWQRGAFYGLVLWGFLEVVLMPVAGMGFFAGGVTVAFAALVGASLFGATVGYLYEH